MYAKIHFFSMLCFTGQMTNGDPGTPGPQQMASGPHKIYLGDPRVPLYFGLFYKNVHCRCNIFIILLVDRPYFKYLFVRTIVNRGIGKS